MRPLALAYVNRGRWLAACPFQCGGADIADRDWFICRQCLNHPVDGHRIPLVWPSADDMAAIEAALVVRPLHAQNWEPNESIGSLLAENVEHGLFDPTTGAVAGDVGAEQNRLPGILALTGARRELAA